MDWVHCNNCFIQPGDFKERKFLITNCGHIYCSDCIQLSELKKCRICQSSYQTMPLSSKMSKEVEIYFRDPTEEIQKQVKILEFQKNHRIRLCDFNREKLMKYKELKKECIHLVEQVKRLEIENLSLHDEIKRINVKLLEYKQEREHLNKNKYVKIPNTNSCELLANGSCDPLQKVTPKLTIPDFNASFGETQNAILVQPRGGSNFFTLTSSKSSQSNTNLFTPLTTLKTSGTYRGRSASSHIGTPKTPASAKSEDSHKDLYHRKVRLPGDKSGTLSAARSAFQQLTLSKLTSIQKRDASMTRKYSQYLN